MRRLVSLFWYGQTGLACPIGETLLLDDVPHPIDKGSASADGKELDANRFGGVHLSGSSRACDIELSLATGKDFDDDDATCRGRTCGFCPAHAAAQRGTGPIRPSTAGSSADRPGAKAGPKPEAQ
jgi:hypothetical protein